MLDGILWKLLICLLNWGFVAILLMFYIAGLFS